MNKHTAWRTLFIISILCVSITHGLEVEVIYDRQVDSLTFASRDIQTALNKTGNTFTTGDITEAATAAKGPRIIMSILGHASCQTAFTSAGGTLPSGLHPEGFAIHLTEKAGTETWWVWGADMTGAMYGGLDLAETISLDGFNAITEKTQNRHLEKRGLKLNIPLDTRTPSYSDAGSAAQANIPEMWSWDFWTNHLDNLARYRYNSITLWSLHHFPSLVKVPDYPDVALDDVKRTTRDLKAWYPNYANPGTTMYNDFLTGEMETVKTITIDEKIKFWQDVMEYAHHRGITFYLITWNVFVSSAEKHYGITPDQSNEVTKDYLRKSVQAAFETYPLLGGIGVTAGENMKVGGAKEKESWLWDTYGQGLMDAKRKDKSNREYRFIHRYWWSNIPDILSYFEGFDDDIKFDFSYKYARARLYSHTDPTFIKDALTTLPAGNKFWLNLRNDDIFNFRWGDPDYVREYINNFPPLSQTVGFHMGSDGYVWGREHTSTEPESPRQLEVEKHWYQFMLWGRLGYDPTLGNSHFAKVIQSRFAQVPAKTLMDLWQTASKIIPAVNRAHWHDWDFQWAVEYCSSKSGFHHIDEKQWEPGGADAAQEIKGYAQEVLNNIGGLRNSGGKELRLTLGDLEAMAHLGNYYAEKILAVDRDNAVEHLKAAAAHWRRYAAVASSQYTPQLLGRAGWGDWKEGYGEVLKDIARKGGTGDPPSLNATAGGTLFEAEQAQAQSAVSQSSISGYTGTGYMAMDGAGSSISFTIDVPLAGEYKLEFRYILAEGAGDMSLSVNGQDQGPINFWQTGGRSSWAWDRKPAVLKQGTNTVVVTSTGPSPKLDHVNVWR
ncbi:CBM35 domain-containing protein [Planctomycetota bacterium]